MSLNKTESIVIEIKSLELSKIVIQESLLGYQIILAGLEKIASEHELDCDMKVAMNPELKNDTQRKANKKLLLASSEAYQEIQSRIESTKNDITKKEFEIKKTQIEIDYQKRLYEISMIALKAGV
jgi:hypothetical protein